jgi:hypothetical protein
MLTLRPLANARRPVLPPVRARAPAATPRCLARRRFSSSAPPSPVTTAAAAEEHPPVVLVTVSVVSAIRVPLAGSVVAAVASPVAVARTFVPLATVTPVAVPAAVVPRTLAVGPVGSKSGKKTIL